MKAFWMLLIVAVAALNTGCSTSLMRESDLREASLRQRPVRHEPEGQLFNRGYKHTPQMTLNAPSTPRKFCFGAGDGVGQEVFARAVTLARTDGPKGWNYANDRAVYAAFEPRRPVRIKAPAGHVAEARFPSRIAANVPEQEMPEPIAELTEVLAGEASETTAEDAAHLDGVSPTLIESFA
jgi:anti-sigma factor RsiW